MAANSFSTADDALIIQNYNIPGAGSIPWIAGQLGRTKNSIIGRACRLGLSATIRGRKRAPAVRLGNVYDPTIHAPATIKRGKPYLVPALPRQKEAHKRPDSPWKVCQWIDGHGAKAGRCCSPTVDGTSWCSEHRDRVYVKRRTEAA